MQRSVTAKIDCSGFVASWSNDLLASSASTKCDVLAKAMRASFSCCCSTQRAHGPRTPKHGGRYRKWTGAWPFSFFGASKACQNHAKYIVDVAELQCSETELYTRPGLTHIGHHTMQKAKGRTTLHPGPPCDDKPTIRLPGTKTQDHVSCSSSR